MTDKTHPASVDVDALAEVKRLVLMAIIDATRDTGAEPSLSVAARSLDTAFAAIDALALAARQAPAPQVPPAEGLSHQERLAARAEAFGLSALAAKEIKNGNV